MVGGLKKVVGFLVHRARCVPLACDFSSARAPRFSGVSSVFEILESLIRSWSLIWRKPFELRR